MNIFIIKTWGNVIEIQNKILSLLNYIPYSVYEPQVGTTGLVN